MRISESIIRSPARTVIIGFVNALFTSTSAVCATGLTVIDTGKDGDILILPGPNDKLNLLREKE
jgi:hypothetical protein